MKKKEQLQTSFDMWALGVIVYITLTGVHPLIWVSFEAEIAHHIIFETETPQEFPDYGSFVSDAIEVIEKLIDWKSSDSRRISY
jgi:serine/threonine protein kinase